MSNQTQPDRDAEQRDSDKDDKIVGTESYHSLLSVIQHNSGSPQHPMCDVTAVRMIFAGYKGGGVETCRKALRMAKRKGDVVEWEDNGEWTGGNSRTRLGLTLEGVNKTESCSYPFTPDDKSCIERIRDIEVENEPVNSDVVGWAEQHRIEIEDRFDEDASEEVGENAEMETNGETSSHE